MKHHWINPCDVHLEQQGRRMCEESWHCMWCDGGLEYCDVCGAFEGATPTHCPGQQMDRITTNKVYETDLDFVNGSWVRNPRKDGIIGCFREIYKHYPREEQVFAVRAMHAGWESLPSMEKEKMSRGW